MASYYVDPFGGDDGNDGLAPASAFRSIDRGTQGLVAGDELRLHAWSVHGPTVGFSAKLRGKEAQGGQPAVPIVIRPYAGAEAVIDGRMRTPDTGVVLNTEWEEVPGGHAEEWRTRKLLDGPVRHGAFVDSRIRLISYSRIEDLRAMNESFRAVPLSDPRGAGGPLVKDPTRKQPWTYFGPGLHWVPEHADDPDDPRGRVHVRLSETHLGAAGTRDYLGPRDPNRVALALTPEDRKTVVVASSNIELRNLVIANGGETTLQVTNKARNVTFDHCSVYGAREGVRISGSAKGITFTHCTFDGGLAPWTVRSDVKNEYSFIDDKGRKAKNGTGRRTHAHLVISSAASGARFVHCTFRRAHDALLLGGKDARVHHCLFEDLNDEVVQFNAPTNAHVYKNLFRQVLHPFSFALEEGGGPIFIYRNVIDQRLPTRGYRTLPPDAPGPHIFRYGASYKTGHPMPAVYVYQNTFVAADRDDKATALSLLFARSDRSAEAPRVHLNNLLIGLDLDLPYTWLATPSALRRSDGNLWYAPQRDLAPLALFRRADGSVEKVRTVARMHGIGAELSSLFTEPMLANFDDEIFDHGRYLDDDHPNNDWRPAPGSPAIAAGVRLPDDLEDPDRPEGSIKPDIGAAVAGGPPLSVGADEIEQPAPNAPIARAGPDRLVTDPDGNGFASVTIDGSGSTTPVGTITSYIWTNPRVTVATGPTATLFLPEGDHYLRLTVTNSAGETDTDGLRVKIRPPSPHGDNLVQNGGFEDGTAWQITGASIVSEFAHRGRRALRLDSQAAVVKQRIPVTPECRYKVSAWVRRASLFQQASMRTTVVFLDRDDAELATTETTFPALDVYAYRQTFVVAPPGAVAMDLELGGNVAGTTRLFADAIRVLDDNLLTNAGFETRAPSGRDDEAPGWRFEAGGGRLVTEPVNRRSGTRALALEGTPADYRQVTQEIRTLAEATRYRITAWLKTVDLTAAPTMSAAFDDGSDHVVAEETSPGVFKLIGGGLEAPPGAERLTVRLRLERGASGTAYVDDLLVVPLP